MKNGKEIKRGGRGLATAVAIAILLGTLLPLFGSTTQASEANDFASDNSIDSSLVEPSTNLTSADSGDISPLGIGAGNVYGIVKFVDADAAGNDIGERTLLRFARVRIFNVNPSGSDKDITYDYTTVPPTVKDVYTNKDGYFSFYIDPDYSISDQYYAVIYSESRYANVKDGGQYTNRSDSLTVSADELESATWPIYEFKFDEEGYPNQPAWNILDSVTEAAEWVKARTGGWTRGRIDVKFPVSASTSSWEVGLSKEWINIIQDDGWRDYKIYHEYGHAIMYTLYGTMPAGDVRITHYLNLESTLEFAIKEGWATLFEYIIGGGSWGIWWDNTKTGTEDVEYANRRNGSGKPAIDYKDWWGSDTNNDGIIERDKVEGNILGILYDIWDTPETNDYYFPWDTITTESRAPYDDDGLALGFGPIWDVMRFRTPHTVYEFWDGWFTNYGTGDSYAARTTANSRHWIKSIYFNHGIDPGSTHIPAGLRLPQNAPIVTDFQITSTGPYNDNKWIDYKLILSDEPEDQNFLRVRLEYESTPGVWVQFHEVENKNMPPTVGGYYTYNVLASALASKSGDGTWSIRAVVDDDMLETISTNTLSVVIDNTKPTSSVTQSGAYWRNSPATITATAFDINGVKDVTLRYRYSADNATWGSWANYVTDTAAPWEWSFTWPSGRGYYEFHTIATDNAGNVEGAKTVAEAAYFYIYPPSGKIYINGDAPQTKSRNAIIDMSNIATIGPSRMRFANDLNYDWHTNYWTIQSQHPVKPGDTRSIELPGTPETTKMTVHFERIDIMENVDYIHIKDSNNNVLASFTGSHTNVEWTSSEADNINWIEIYMYIGSHLNGDDYYGFKIDRYGYYTQRWSNWETFSASREWTLSPGYGEKTVYCQVTDVGGNPICQENLFNLEDSYIPG